MSILQSLLIKLGMLAMTMGVVLWIGWQVPQTMQRPAVSHAASFSSESAAETTVPAVDSKTSPASVSEGRMLSGRPPRVDLNGATAADFDQLPGVGPVLAKRMVDYRKSVGRFHAVEDLRAVKGIGKKKLEQLKPFVTVTKSATLEEGKKGPI
ncbi:MAG: helix-hairpin-helix domain-containing protein [Nitrospira sp.]|nr:helix-hairpin-helix domain-containing protein [Nitrospira sp.]